MPDTRIRILGGRIDGSHAWAHNYRCVKQVVVRRLLAFVLAATTILLVSSLMHGGLGAWTPGVNTSTQSHSHKGTQNGSTSAPVSPAEALVSVGVVFPTGTESVAISTGSSVFVSRGSHDLPPSSGASNEPHDPHHLHAFSLLI
jgi:anti-sigma factor RsiW